MSGMHDANCVFSTATEVRTWPVVSKRKRLPLPGTKFKFERTTHSQKGGVKRKLRVRADPASSEQAHSLAELELVSWRHASHLQSATGVA
jgi:hypothetical protein